MLRKEERRFGWPLRRPARQKVAPTSLADKVFPPTPTLRQRLQALAARAQTAWQARRVLDETRPAARWGLPSASAFWRRAGGQTLRTNRAELSRALRFSRWSSAVSERLFVKLLRWSWRQRHSWLLGFAWRAVRKTLQAEWAETRHSFRLWGSAFLLWQKAALRVAWWDLRRRFRRSTASELSHSHSVSPL